MSDATLEVSVFLKTMTESITKVEKQLGDMADKVSNKFSNKLSVNLGNQNITNNFEKITNAIVDKVFPVVAKISDSISFISNSIKELSDPLRSGVLRQFTKFTPIFDRFKASLGDTKALIRLILDQGFQFLSIILPKVDKNQKLFANFKNGLDGIQKTVSKKEFQQLAEFGKKRELPFFERITLFAEEFKLFLSELLKQIKAIQVSLQFGFSLSKKELLIIESQSEKLSKNTNQRIENFNNNFNKVLGRSSELIEQQRPKIEKAVEKSLTTISGLVSKLAKVFVLGITTIITLPFTLTLGLLTLPFKLIGAILKIRKARKKAEEERLAEEARRKKAEEDRLRRKKAEEKLFDKIQIRQKKANDSIASQTANFEKLEKSLKNINKLFANQFGEAVKKQTSTFGKLEESVKSINSIFEKQFAESFVKVSKTITNLTGNINKLVDSLKELSKSNVKIPDVKKQFGQRKLVPEAEKTKEAGAVIVRRLAKGIEESKGLVKKASKEVVSGFTSFFPFPTVQEGQLKNTKEAGKKIVSTLLSGIKETKGITKKKAESKAKDIFSSFADGARTTEKSISGFVKALNSVKNIGKKELSDTGKNIVGRLAKSIEESKDLARAAKAVIGSFLDYFPAPNVKEGRLKNVKGIGKDIVSKILKGIEQTKTDISKTLKGFTTSLTKPIKDSVKELSNEVKFKDVGKNFILDLVSGIDSAKKSFVSSLKNVFNDVSNTTKGLPKTTDELNNFVKALNGLQKSLSKIITKSVDMAKLKGSGKEVMKQLADGVKDSKEFAKAADKQTKGFMLYFPQSPAKLGALRNLKISGREMILQLVQGIRLATPLLQDTASKLATIIIKPLQLASNTIKNISRGFTSQINKTIDEATKTRDLSLISGTSLGEISKLDAAFRSIGQRATDNQVVFSRMQKTLNGLGKEGREKLNDIGISVSEINRSTEPTVELFKRVSDVVRNSQRGSEEFKTALEAIGVTGESKLIPVLTKGGDELDRLFETSKNFGSALDEGVTKSASNIRGLRTNLDFIFSSLRNDFVGTLLPTIEKSLKSTVDFFNKNSRKIRAFFLGLGNTIANLISVTSAFFNELIVRPKKAFEVAGDVLNALSGLFSSVFDRAFTIVSDNATVTIRETTLAILQGTKATFLEFLGIIGEQIDLRIAKLLLQFEDFATNVDNIAVKTANKFLTNTLEVGRRWFSIAFTFVDEAVDSIGRFVDNIFLKFTIELLRLKKSVLETVEDILNNSSVKSLFEFLGFDAATNLRLQVAGVGLQIEEIQKKINQNNDVDNFLERVAGRVDLINESFGDTGKKIEDINNKISKSNDEFLKKSGEAFKGAFINARTIIDNFKESSKGLFDKEAIDEYKKSLEEAIDRIKGAVEGTELKEPVKKLIDELQVDFINSIQEVKDSGVFDFSEDVKFTKGDGEDKNKSLFDSLKLKDLASDFSAINSVASTATQTFKQLFEVSGKKAKEFAKIAKATAILEAVSNTAVAVTQALKLPFPLNISQAALVGLQGGLQVGTILSQPDNFNTGGMVRGREGFDKIPAMLTNEEFVINRFATKKIGADILDKINRGELTRKDLGFSNSGFTRRIETSVKNGFNSGGFVNVASKLSEISSKESLKDKINFTNVNVTDPRQIVKALETSEGSEALLNWISNENVEVKERLQ